MKITRLQLTIEPSHFGDAKTLRVEVIADGIRYETVTYVEDDDFESLFERMMDNAKRELLRLIKAKDDERSRLLRPIPR